MPYAVVGGERVFYALHRSTLLHAPHLVLIHGAGGNHQHWGSAVRNLRMANVYALDLPGHGHSSGIGLGSIPDYASLIPRFLDALQIGRALVAGHSMGGAIALQVALDRPQRVSALILVGTGARLRVLPAILDGILSDPASTVEFICATAYSSSTPRELVRQGQRQMLGVAPQTIHDDFAACDLFDVIGRLEEIHCPTLVVCGTEDRLTPVKYSTFLTEKIAGADLKLIEGAGHMVMTEKPEFLAQALQVALASWKI